MRWEGERESSNVEDYRGGGGGGGFGLGGGTLSIGAIVIALVGGAIFGINPLTILGLLSGGCEQVQQAPAHQPPANDRTAKFASVVLANNEDVWTQVFSKGGATYQPTKLALFEGAVRTGCGAGQSAMGPFYCPADSKVYIDLGFYRTLRDQLGAPGEFAQAYVIAHEVGHHVQHLLGITD
ncbi:MAG TPA: neutral zinc metallopeptidase, partial [Ramlibacter sp.]